MSCRAWRAVTSRQSTVRAPSTSGSAVPGRRHLTVYEAHLLHRRKLRARLLPLGIGADKGERPAHGTGADMGSNTDGMARRWSVHTLMHVV